MALLFLSGHQLSVQMPDTLGTKQLDAIGVMYSSEALAGVVIITEGLGRTSGGLSVGYGVNKTSDLTGDLSLRAAKTGLYLFSNRYRSDGVDSSSQPDTDSPSLRGCPAMGLLHNALPSLPTPTET